jgi:hypothetical protein
MVRTSQQPLLRAPRRKRAIATCGFTDSQSCTIVFTMIGGIKS